MKKKILSLENLKREIVKQKNKGKKIVKQNDIIVVPKGVPHLITCIEGPGARYAITKPDNISNIRLNQKLGFKIIGNEKINSRKFIIMTLKNNLV